MADSTWKTVETGAVPDYVLVDSFSDNPDYSVLYNIDKISELMNKSKPSGSSGDNTVMYVIIGVVAAIIVIGALVFVLRRNH
jgi:hypothetical protein